MTDSKTQAQSLFLNALEIRTEGERAAYVEAHCGADPELRKEVEELLDHARRLGPFLEPGEERIDGTIAHPITEQAGDAIGPYKLLQQIGEGGFGVVFLAEQTEPLQRTVALKIIKPGMDTRQVIARFEAERQALSMMDHPNIARVLDAGTTDTGRPYFVMDLVKGVPITDYCDRQHLPVRQRLELMAAVCQAVQHAHQKGIIHRDIKPSNVLVAEYDGRPVPKVIDFGVAKATAQCLTEKTMFTELGQMVGTVEYMSPEQARFNQLDIDTRSDIYSLGVLLYELLTGSTPFARKRLYEAAFDEMLRIIREEEPPKPSTRLSSSDALPSIAANRGSEPLKLNRLVQGELDWIVMKALEKDRDRRYESASDLAKDVERYLGDEPVQACPPSLTYRLKKYVRRNKVVTAFVALLLIGVGGLGVSSVMIKRERDAKTTALASAQTVSNLLQDMLASSNPDQVKGSQYTVRELLDDFSAKLGDQLADQPEVEATIRSLIGKSYWRLGFNATAELNLKKSLDLRRKMFGANDERVADTLVDYAWSLAEQGRNAEAEKHVREALSIYQEHHCEPRVILHALWPLQRFLVSQFRFDEAEQVANRSLDLVGDGQDSDNEDLANILHTLAEAKMIEAKYEEAEKLARRAVEMHRHLQGDRHPETAWGLWFLGRALRGQQKLVEAEAPLRESLAIFRDYYTPEHYSVQSVNRELALVLEARGDRAGLEALARQEVEQESRTEGPANHARLAGLLLANNLPTDAQVNEAHRLIRQAIDEYGQVAVAYASDLNLRLEAAEGYIGVIKICSAAPGFSKESDEVNRILKSELSELVATHPDFDAEADVLHQVAIVQLQMGDTPGFRATCKALIELPVRGTDYLIRSRTIWTLCLAPDALEDLSLPVKLGEDLVAHNSLNNPPFFVFILGAAHYRAGEYEQAAQSIEKAIEAIHNGPARVMDSMHYHRQLFLAMTKWQLGQRDAARSLLAKIQPAVEEQLQSPLRDWSHRATLELLRKEAVALIGQEQIDEVPKK